MHLRITPELIRETLDKKFAAIILSRAYPYFKDGHVFDLKLGADEFSARVSGSHNNAYTVKGDVRFGQLVLSCSCPYEDHCKHEAAVLYEIRESLSGKKDPAAGKMARQKTAKKNKTRKSAAENVPKMEGVSSGVFRRLPLEQVSLTAIVGAAQDKKYAKSWSQPFKGHLASDGLLTLLLNTFAYPGYQKNEIELKREQGEVWVKCNSCNEPIPYLCQHQMLVLAEASEVLSRTGFLQPEFDFEALWASAVEKVRVDPAAFSTYFRIILTRVGFGVEPKKANIFFEDWMDKTKAELSTLQQKRSQESKVLEQQLKEGGKEKFAFLWLAGPFHEYSYHQPLQFMQGYGLKTKEGIRSSDRTITDLPYGFDEAQMEVARQLYFLLQESTPNEVFYPLRELIEQHVEILNEVYQYASSPSMRVSEMQLFKFHPVALEARFSFRQVDGLLCITREVFLEEEAFDINSVEFSNGVFCATASTAYLYPHPEFERFMERFGPEDRIYMPKPSPEELTTLVEDFKKYFETTVEENLTLTEEILTNPTFQILLREVGEFIIFEPRLSYGEYSINAFNEGAYFIAGHLNKVDEADRFFLVDFIKNAHPDFDHPIQVQDFVYLPIHKMLDNYWFLHFNEACEAASIELLGQKDLSKFKYSQHKAVTFSHVKSGIDWFGVDMGVSFGKEKVKMADWIRALRNHESFVTLKDGTLGILPEEWLAQARKVLAVADFEKGELKISKYRFNIIEELFEDLDDKKIIKELKQKKKRLAELEFDKKYEVPKRIHAELRPYQKHGFAWLKFLEESGFGGILADDMGLGKTLQVLALLADQYNQAPSLIVVPRSLLFNWSAEIDKFCPTLSYVVHHGAGRARSVENLLAYELVITTYGTATSDIQLLKDFNFNYIVLDESQAIKNPGSKRYKAMRLLRSRHKLTMTGTPIENNTFDLYAQLSFSSPGLLGSQLAFKKNFAVPIDNNRDQEAANLLRKMIHPFVLRRTKEQVAKELPEKTETVIYCEMGNSQRKLYENLKQKIKEDIETELEEKGFEKSRFKMLDGLLRLRQMCNSPLLLNQSFKGQNAQSVKIDILIQNLTEELDNHSALVFSQFVGFLSLVRHELDKLGIKYAYLDGSTTQRQAEVEKFMENEEVRIFLISIKAGNTGLNLTKADYVYILDPWWNPAVESQAIDRTHRIGQDKNVFAYKLICKDSIEEKILKLQERKKEISTELIRTDESAFKSLSKEEMLDLFN